MTKKYNNDSPFFKDWTTKKLKQEAKAYDQLINVIECYGMSDLRNSIGIENELQNRGVEITREICFE